MTPAPSTLLSLAFCLLTLAGGLASAREGDPVVSEVPARGCATHLEVMRLLEQDGRAGLTPDGQAASTASAASAARAAKANAASLYGRTYLTPRFALHYTVAPTVNRARWVPESPGEPALKALVDSLLASFPSQAASVRDSMLHAKLDSLNAAHPQYVVKAGEYFERAWRHYDSLGMRMPDSSASLYFKAPVHGRVAIDIANIGTMIPEYQGAYYGLAFPPGGGQGASILLENDFLYGATYSASSGQVTGTPIRAVYKGETYRDYSAAWDMGLKVTASHEFYHIVQYEYTPSLSGYHAWYELSATGMEERLAPEVNDYFQYLPFNLQRTHDVPLTTAGTLANYGNAVFHVYVTHARGAAFDVAMWEYLADTNSLAKAWVHTAGSHASWDSLLNDYAAAISLSGTPGAIGSPLAFSSDMAQWPVPFFDDVPAANGSQLTLAPSTFRLVRAPTGGNGLANLTGFTSSRRVDSSAAGYQATIIDSSVVGVAKGAGVTRSTSVFAHTGFTGTRNVLLSKPGTEARIARNPIARDQGPLFVLAPTGGTQDTLQVVSESGRRVATVPVDTTGAFWIWDLKDEAARTVPAGLYFLRRSGGSPKSLLILP